MVNSVALSTVVLPVAKAGVSFQFSSIMNGVGHGVIRRRRRSD